MRILVSNDDGVYAPGLAALSRQMQSRGTVEVVAPATEQSGVGHAITYRTPLTCKSIHQDGKHWAWAVDGSPADCVKLAISELFADDPVDLVVSGINHGLNVGINVLYSGTVAAAIEGAFFGVTSVAVSLEYDEDADFDAAAEMASRVINRIAAEPSYRGGLFNINVSTSATRRFVRDGLMDVQIVPMGLAQYGRSYDCRKDPDGNPYYWALWTPPADPPPQSTDVARVLRGGVTVTPLHFDLTHRQRLETMSAWQF
ncbi:MAG: 5'/3'-nucleotidase SurE [Planctomycetota bacterium]